ncbi:hypothetical protein WN943_022498 [Citrus x changshan-huyou]
MQSQLTTQKPVMKIEKGLGVSYKVHEEIFNAPKVIFSFPFLGLFPMISISLLIYNDSDCHQQPGDSGQVLVPYVLCTCDEYKSSLAMKGHTRGQWFEFIMHSAPWKELEPKISARFIDLSKDESTD